MKNVNQSGLEFSVTELETRLEEQSFFAVILAIFGVISSGTAQASTNTCGPFGGEACGHGCICRF